MEEKTFINHQDEANVLGMIIRDNDILFNTIQHFNPIMFDHPDHFVIANTMVQMFNKGNVIDVVSLSIELREKPDSLKFRQLVVQLSSAPHTFSAEKLVYALNAMWITRSFKLELQNTIFKLQTSSDTLETMEEGQKKLTEILTTSIASTELKGLKVYDQVIEKNEIAINNPTKLVGIDTGVQKLNEMTGGYQPTELIILAARPGMGKTSFMLTSAKMAVFEQKKKVAIFSLEMSADQLMNKLIAMETKISVQKIKSLNLQPWELEIVKAKRSEIYNSFIFDDKSHTLTAIRSKCRLLWSKYGVSAIYIDYLQLISNKGKGNREQEISEISRTLKLTAKELGVPIMALSQLSRSVEQRGGSKIPMLSDLRESGAIEQDADMVIFVHRPYYYGDPNDYPSGVEQDCSVIVAKNRNGGTGITDIWFEQKTTSFLDPSRPQPSNLDTALRPNENF